MRPTLLAALIVLGFAAQASAQSVALPSVSFPEPGTFCGPFQLCQPDLVTQGTNG
ncbi:hypothetical protein [Gymnodinialimonas hymeniacidonis]|uniref:hypothetical protein n=1 Tax=Gymnodinialimonas hymeniacidonis TaxID=3126508 RepID=UPI0034C62EDB